MTPRLATLLVFLALQGCASKSPPEARSPEPAAAAIAAVPAASAGSSATQSAQSAQRTAAASALAVERQWLASWFKGTPVVIAQLSNGAVVIEVPARFCFEPGQEAVKPALAAVLDKVARSMRRTAIAELHLIAAPGDPGSPPTLGTQRATRVYEFLRARGLTEGRLAKPSASRGMAVKLRIEASSPGLITVVEIR